jgi:GMP synthase-like glutamine amidotransferase
MLASPRLFSLCAFAMKPVAILQYYWQDGTGFFETHLRARGVPWRLYRFFDGEAAPEALAEFGGLAILGGPMSVNDDLPQLRAGERLVVCALRDDVPVLGHCLGGQMLSKVAGGAVTRAPTVEIGWSQITATDSPLARHWFGTERFPMFQWHNETFSLPAGAELIATGVHCANQAFAFGTRHIGMQFHCEMDEFKVNLWLDPHGRDEIAHHAASLGVQTPAQIIEQSSVLLVQSQRVAAAIYDRWLEAQAR